MVCYTFYIFNREGVCQFYHEWNRSKPHPEGTTQQEEFKLVFGLIWSMKTFVAAMDPKGIGKRQVGAPARIGQGCSFRSFATNRFRLHFLESPSGLKFVLLTDPGTVDMSEVLWAVYAGPFVQHVVKNPLYRPGDAFM